MRGREVDGVVLEVVLEAVPRVTDVLVVRCERRAGAGGHRLAERPRHVAEVRQGARKMSVLDVEVKILVVAALDRLHEVREVLLVAAARPLAEFVAVVVAGNTGGVVRPDGEPRGAIPDVAGPVEWTAVLQAERDGRLDRQAADIGDQQGIVPLKDGHLAVGHVAIIDVTEPTAETHHPLGKFLLADTPAGLVEFVGILVAKVAVAGDVIPVPVVMELLAGRDLGRGGARPEVEVESRRDRCGGVDQPDAGPFAVADGPGHLHVADLPALHEVERFPHAGRAAALHAHLAHASELPRPLRHHAAFLHVVAAGLFHVDVLARLHRPDGHEGVPVVGRGDRDGIDVLAVQKAADILHVGGRVQGILETLLAQPHVGGWIAVADRHQFDIRVGEPLADVRRPLTVDADRGDADFRTVAGTAGTC